MSRITKKMRLISQKISVGKLYSFKQAIELLYCLPKANFIENIDATINLNINSKKSDQNLHNSVKLPYVIEKKKSLVVFADGADKKSAYDLGVELSGMEEIADKIKNNKKIKIDFVIAMPYAMSIVEKLGPILGPRGLMPNPKNGTITDNVTEAIKNIQQGQVTYRNDKYGIIHMTIGKINFEFYKLEQNLLVLLKNILKNKPSPVKGAFIKQVNLAKTMGGSVLLDHNEFLQKV
ncbi:50S ribosomal subunit protein L1 [Wigglesworthia glossinidia endosymbiont of Glossina morsitans morsitans (Yale colony)]|uniref:Ribosomal protein n=1 Tax=Wigglesworthia glossinidia endosymbiont of Glossina morsitans morsitans (Yale colony) TaxID=1142511 RepID=H6Q4L8_WIGGL|nr:50S ribosomal protein L1 [Wigglesworthia glossinidia]AFA41078.1 50S ribosomal subunit protein L1 [Wigglesworthia glossinidia endosymbiont of Glossina morsitans morsitans (Yale colony)]